MPPRTGATRPQCGAPFSPDGTRISTGGGIEDGRTNGEVTVWDARTGTPLLRLTSPAEQVTSVAFSPDGTRVLSGDSDGTTRSVGCTLGQALLRAKCHIGPVRSVAFSPDGTRIVTGNGDYWTAGPGDANVWDARTGGTCSNSRGTEGWYKRCFQP